MICITLFASMILETSTVISNIKKRLQEYITLYISLFSRKNLYKMSSLCAYLIYICMPIILLSVAIFIGVKHDFYWLYIILNGILFYLSVNVYTWKKITVHSLIDCKSLIMAFHQECFAVVCWFMICPTAVGAVLYFMLNIFSLQLAEKSDSSFVYSIIADKILFWINIIPSAILIMLISLVGDFEKVLHYLLEHGKQFNCSYHYLEELLTTAVFIATGNSLNTDDYILYQPIEQMVIMSIKALLYRSVILLLVLITGAELIAVL